MLTVEPEHYQALYFMGYALIESKRLPAAQAALERAIAVDPHRWEAHFYLGDLYRHRRMEREAIAEFEAALGSPERPEVARLLLDLLRTHEPEEAYLLACKLARRGNEDVSLLGAFPVLVDSCEWQLVSAILPAVTRLASASHAALGGVLFPMNRVTDAGAALLFDLHKRYGELTIANASLSEPEIPHISLERPLRVGYLSGDFREHSVAYFVRNLIEHHDRQRFSVYCYSNSPLVDQMTESIRCHCQHFAAIHNLSDEELARRIQADGIDILVDLAGHTRGTRMPAMRFRPAPVKITYLGYPNTTGLPTVDFRISDARSESRRGTRYTEQLLLMPESFLCFGHFEERPLLSNTPARSLGSVTFGCFNHINKLNPETIESWSAVLRAVAASKLLLKSGRGSRPEVVNNLYAEFAKHGVGAERIEIRGYVADKSAHLDMYNEVDIAFDTHPYNGTTTTCEALWMGVPLLTLKGELHASRVSGAILELIGIEEMVTATPAEFVQRAIELAGDPDRLDGLRQKIPQRLRDSILCQPERFTRQFESTLAVACREKGYRLPWLEEHDVTPQIALKEAGRRALDIRIKGDVRVHVPDSVQLLTSYVLQEQEDWFEPELEFVRNWLKPGMNAVDIGANYGIYTLTAAHRCAPSGKVWCFEPASATAACLRRAISINRLGNITLSEAGVSDTTGEAQLRLHRNSELNTVMEADENDLTGPSEPIALTTLDSAATEHDFPRIDFLKLDAEGFETKVLAGAHRFFKEQSPLVLFEVKHGASLNLDLTARFAELGMTSYRLVPGAGVLVPFDASTGPDPFLLNLFACSSTRAVTLAEQGLLCNEPVEPSTLTPPAPGTWVNLLFQYPYASQLTDRWTAFIASNSESAAWAAHGQALDFYTASKTEPMSACMRHAHLEAAYRLLGTLVTDRASFAATLSFARVALEVGRQGHAAEALRALRANMADGLPTVPDEPFLPVSDVFEWLEPGEMLAEWLKAGVLERLERARAFSGYFTEYEEQGALQELRELGFQSPEMERRRQLQAIWAGLQSDRQPAPILGESSPYNLNPELWAR